MYHLHFNPGLWKK